MADRQRAARYFEQFSRIAKRESPLYSKLSGEIAGDEELLSLTDEMIDHQPPANVLLAAVHFLLLRGAKHDLGAYYQTVGGEAGADDAAFAAFKAFCIGHRDDLMPLLRRGRVQTNEVRRATFLVPAFAWVAGREQQPLATLEVGTAAGLLTIWDRYAYDYGEAHQLGDSPLTLSCEIRGGAPELLLPERAWSAGIDIEPVHVDDPDASDWLRSLVWPDQLERMHRLEAAIEIAKSSPPQLIAGDGIDMLLEAATAAPNDATLVVHHSFALNQVTIEDRARLERALADLSQERIVYLVAVEWAGPDERPELRAGKAQANAVPRKTLARVHHHGAWLDWVA